MFTCTEAQVPNDDPSPNLPSKIKSSRTPRRQSVKRQKSELLAILEEKRYENVKISEQFSNR